MNISKDGRDYLVRFHWSEVEGLSRELPHIPEYGTGGTCEFLERLRAFLDDEVRRAD